MHDDLGERRRRQAKDDAAHALVAHQQAAAGAEDAEGNLPFDAALHDGAQLGWGARLDQRLGGSADLQRGERRQRLALAGDGSEFFQHAALLAGGILSSKPRDERSESRGWNPEPAGFAALIPRLVYNHCMHVAHHATGEPACSR